MKVNKFSLLAYAGERNESESLPDAGTGVAVLQEPAGDDAFLKLASEIRGELAAARGRTEEERQQYGDTLNRAVLGYEEDRRTMMAIIQDLLAKRRIHDLPSRGRTYDSMAEAIFAEVIGMNVLELILKSREGIEEIQVVGCDIFEVRGGIPMRSPHRMQSFKDLERIQQNLVLFNNDTLNPRKRWAEVMLRDGSRVTMTGFGFTAQPTLTIRFYTVKHYELATLCRPAFETIDEPMRELILCVIRSYFNMVVIGPTNSGKTNLIKAFIAEMPGHERIVTIESRYELMLKRDFPDKNVIEYEVNEDDPPHSSKQAFKLALRQSPKRICHAEVRDEDANVYVRACTRGHEGSVTTVHVNALEDVPDAITDMCMLDGRGMNPGRLVKRIAEFVTQVGFEMALVGGKRKIVRIAEYGWEQGEVALRDWVLYNSSAGTWSFPMRVSQRAAERMRRYDPSGYRRLTERGWLG
ncbi:ATPase, T2SS/T4P/T4SS family [Paenibacillus contaminans]|uniref:ATPase, T2SS/T4P/T4SS family n=1 Tax=Paenibacillus contaminans TaxID=450362 RepID=UPI001EDFE867|nr:ATPase, T2SS/T4P/T4SS family [Paenibacillus contaminans]